MIDKEILQSPNHSVSNMYKRSETLTFIIILKNINKNLSKGFGAELILKEYIIQILLILWMMTFVKVSYGEFIHKVQFSFFNIIIVSTKRQDFWCSQLFN